MSKLVNLNHYNQVTLQDLSLNGDASFNNDVFISNNLVTNNDIHCNNRLFILGDVSLNNDVYVKETFIADGDASLNANLRVSNDTNLNKRLFVSGDVSLNSDLYIKEMLVVDGDASLNANLKVSNDATLNDRLFVSGDASFNNDVFVSSNLVTNNDIRCNNRLFILGDISWNPNNLANDCIPSTAVIGGAGGSSSFSQNGDDIYFNNGNVGIGTTSPSSKLHIQHDQSSMPTGQNFNHDGTLILENNHANTVLNYGANMKFVQRWNSTADTAIEMGAIAGYSGFDGGFGGGLTFWTHPNSNNPMVERMRITDNGNVGIGTTNPVNKLHIYSTTNTSNFRVSNSTSTLGLIVEQSTNKYTYIRNTESIGGIIFHAGNGEKMRIMPDGKVSIHPTGVNPSFQLDVFGQLLAYHTQYGNAGVQLAGRLYKIDGTQDFNPYTGYTTARFQEAIIARSFFAYSDSRIKTNIQEVNDSSALDKLRLLKPSLYNYIDVLARGEKQVYGFLAQEVKEVLPDAVSQYADYIPNIYSLGTYDASTNIITIENENYDTASLSMDASNNVYKNIKIYDASDNVIEVCIEEIVSTKEIKIKQDSEVNIPSSIFVYGQEVEDFHKLNKDAIFTVTTSALQEVDRQLQAEKTKVATLESENATLKTQMEDILSRLVVLESALESN